MMLSELLQRLSGQPTISGRRRFSQSLRQLEALEHRALPAGNVTAQFIGRTLYVNGDSAANSVELAAESGNLVMRGLDGTTVNGSSSTVTLLSGSTVIPRGFYAHMGDGNDRLQVKTGVIVGRESIINGGWGDDAIGVVGAQFGRWLNIYTEAGNDQVSIQNTNIGRSATVMAWGPSLLTNISGSNIGDDLFISTTYGNDGVAITNTRVNDDVTIFTHGGTDDVAIRNSTFGDDLTVATGGEDDVLYIDASTILDHSWLFLGAGNDNFVVEGQSRFNDRIRTYGEGGSDLTEVSTTTVTNGFRTSSISLGNVSDSLVQQRITSPTTGVLSKAAALAAQFSPVLSLQLGSTTVEESGGAAATTLTVSRSVATQTPLTVNLSSSNTAKATVPATATIPAGATSVTINVSAVNNNLFDNDATVTLTASATGFTNATANLSVTNDDVRTLTATVNNATISESAGATAATITVSRNTADTTAALTVNLTTTSNNNRITIPATLTIPAGSASATFNVAAIANTLDDGDVQVTVVASASGFTNGSVNLTVTDDDAPALQLQVASSTVAENLAAGTVTYTLTRNSADISQPLIVNLNAGSQSRLTVPATVTIPANTTTVQFAGTINNNVLDDNNINVQTIASASGFSNVNVTVTVLDDEPSVLGVELSAATISEAAGNGALTATISRTAAGTSDLTVQLIYPQSGRISGPTEVVIPAGQLSVTVNINVVNNSVVEPSQTVVLSAFATNFDSGSDSIVITEDDSLLLTTDVSQNTFTQSNNAVIVQSPAFILAGTSAPGATVTYDSDNDGQFDDGTATADGSGNFSFTSNLTHTTANRGLNVLRVRSELNGISIVKEVDAHLAVGTVVRFETNLGNYDVELLNTAAPNTVQNFLNYMNSTAYDNLIVHRSVNNFVIQGGGFRVNGGAVTAVPTNAAIQNEFNSANSNLRGTLSMALVSGNINSGTSQWFINTVNNTALNAASHTVFGRVIGDGMDVVDAIAAVPIRNLANLYDITALGEVPLLNAPGSGTTLAGTVSVVTGSTQLIGTGTSFTTALQVGDSIELSGRLFFVQSIESNTALTLKSASLITATNVTAKADVTPADADFVVFSNISQLLAAI